jgi:hypothetical protein
MNKNAFLLLSSLIALGAAQSAFAQGARCHDMVTSREEELVINRPFEAAESPQDSLLNRFADLHREVVGETLGTQVPPAIYAQSQSEAPKSAAGFPVYAQ